MEEHVGDCESFLEIDLEEAFKVLGDEQELYDVPHHLRELFLIGYFLAINPPHLECRSEVSQHDSFALWTVPASNDLHNGRDVVADLRAHQNQRFIQLKLIAQFNEKCHFDLCQIEAPDQQTGHPQVVATRVVLAHLLQCRVRDVLDLSLFNVLAHMRQKETQELQLSEQVHDGREEVCTIARVEEELDDIVELLLESRVAELAGYWFDKEQAVGESQFLEELIHLSQFALAGQRHPRKHPDLS
jgi:hypothetical protein